MTPRDAEDGAPARDGSAGSDSDRPGGGAPGGTTRRRFPVRPSILIAVLLAVAATAWIATGRFQGYGSAPETADGTPPAAAESAAGAAPAGSGSPASVPEDEAVAVRVYDSVAQPRVTHLTVTGRTEADRSVELSAETQGRVVAVTVEASERVAAGDKLVELATDDRMARLREARALVEQREIEFNAADKLSEKGFQSQTNRAAAHARLEAAQAQLERVRVDIEKTDIEAPFAGIVESRLVEVGDFARVGDPVIRLVDLDPMLIELQISEREVGRIQVGSQAQIALVSGQEVTGTVRRISPSASAETRTFRVEVEVPNPEGTLRDGVTATVSLPTRETFAHRLSPAVLTLDNAGRIGVKAVNADEEVVFHPVQIVEDRADAAWVTGLPMTATIISVGQEYVAPGAKVRPVQDERHSDEDGTPAAAPDGGDGETWPPRLGRADTSPAEAGSAAR